MEPRRRHRRRPFPPCLLCMMCDSARLINVSSDLLRGEHHNISVNISSRFYYLRVKVHTGVIYGGI